MKRFVRHLFRRLGYDLVRHTPRDAVREAFPDLSIAERDILRRVQPFTMTSPERLAAVLTAVRHVHEQRIPGSLVECGVWRGGSMMAAALMLRLVGDENRDLHLYDTFSGMSAPTAHDRSFDGHDAGELLARDEPQTGLWCFASLEDVRANLLSTGYPAKRIHFHVGKVEETLPVKAPGPIASLRLDTDWYESTRHELEHLYPLLQPGGMLIVDDYGHWQGARRAVDEYLARLPYPLYLHRIDYTGRLALKPRPSAP